MRKKLLTVCLIAVFLASGFAVFKLLAASDCRHAGEIFLTAVASGDTDTALEYAAGQVAWNLKTNASPAAARVIDIDTDIVALGENWARLNATAELVLRDGMLDVGWYQLDMVKEENWKIIAIKETVPDIKGAVLYVKDIPEVREAFRMYLACLENGDYEESLKYLAGPAKRAQEASSFKGKVTGRLRSLKMTPLYARGKLAVFKANYTNDGKPVSVQVVFYKIQDEWKLVSVNTT